MTSLRELAETRHHDHYLEMAQTSDTEWERTENNLPQLRLAWHRLSSNDTRLELWARALDAFFNRRLQHFADYIELLSNFQSLVNGKDDHDGEIWVLNKIGGVNLELNNIDAAIVQLKQSYELAKLHGHETAMADALANLAGAYGLRQQWNDALNGYTEALTIMERNGVWGGKASILNNMGGVCVAMGDYVKARQFFTNALQESLLRNNRDTEAGSLIGLASIDLARKELAEVGANLSRALEISISDGYIHPQANSLKFLGKLKLMSGEYKSAITTLDQALLLYENIQNYEGQFDVLTDIAACNFRIGEQQSGKVALKQSNSLLGHITPDLKRRLTIWNSAGFTFHQLGEFEVALGIYSEILDEARKHNLTDLVALELNNIAGIFRDRGNHSEAMQGYQEALIVCHVAQDSALEPRILHNMGRVLLHQNKCEDALKMFTQAEKLWKNNQDFQGLADTYTYMIKVYEALGEIASVAEIKAHLNAHKR